MQRNLRSIQAISRPFAAAAACILLALLTQACGDSSPEPVVASAFVGPINLPIKDGLTVKANVIGTLKHGDKVGIVSTRRRFFRVRAQGKEGWVDGFQLMTQPEIDELSKLADSTKDLPPQGEASTHEALNVHTRAERHSPSFHQIPERGTVQIIGHVVSERVQGPAPEPPVMEMVKKAIEPPAVVRKKKASNKVPPPPRAAGPPVPKDWQALSVTAMPEEDLISTETTGKDKRKILELRRALMASVKKATGVEDWYLIRLKDGRAGWVLASYLYMTIPDDVAQYAEGSRITSFFPLKEVNDEGVKKSFWLWTTRQRAAVDFQFDSFRVFTWSLKRHRYETAYRENNLKGYYPVTVKTDGPLILFNLIVEEPGPAFFRKTYEFDGRLVRLQGQVQIQDPSSAPQESRNLPASASFAKQNAPAQPQPGWLTRKHDALRAAWKRLWN